jgi:undecaprenyl-diphosphatase
LNQSLFDQINGFAATHRAVEAVAEFLAADAIYVFAIVLVGLFVAPARWSDGRGRTTAASAGLSAALALGAAQIISRIVQQPRPFLANPGHAHVLIGSASDYGFPSDHATAGFAVAVAITMRMPRLGFTLIGLAASIAVARVAVGVHYPADVLGGAAVGALSALLVGSPPIRTLIAKSEDNWESMFRSVRHSRAPR